MSKTEVRMNSILRVGSVTQHYFGLFLLPDQLYVYFPLHFIVIVKKALDLKRVLNKNLSFKISILQVFHKYLRNALLTHVYNTGELEQIG